MIKNYFQTAIRNLLRNKVFSLINVAGLAIGISCCLLATLYINEEFSFDQFHENPEKIYRVAFDNYGNEGAFARTPLPIGPALQEEFSEVEAMTRVNTIPNFLIRNKGNSFFEEITIADNGFFKVFSFDLLKGNPTNALLEPNWIVITERMAKKYFGDEDPIGKTLLIGSSGRLNSIITGVVKDPPGNSQLQFDFLLSFSTIEKLGWPTSLWFQMPNNYTYLRLNANASAGHLKGLFPGFAKKYLGDQLTGTYESTYNLTLQRITDIHLHSHGKGELPTQGNESSIYLFVSVSAIILLIACINYINLTTARYIRRAKEMGVRKVVGANRFQLVSQLLSESILLSLAAGVLAMAMVEFLLPYFNQIANTQIQNALLTTPLMFGTWSILVLIPSVGAGLFPSLYLANINIIHSLKNAIVFSSTGLNLRRALVVFQFFSAAFLLTATLVVFQQMSFIRSSLYQHDQNEQVVVFPISNKMAQSFDVLQNQLSVNHSIRGVSASSSVPGFNRDSWPVKTSLDGQAIRTENYVIDEKYIEVMDYKLLAGRNFDKNTGSDTSSFIINQKAVLEFGFKTPEKAIGQTLYWGSESAKKGTVIGVIKDFNFSSYREEIIPALLQLNTADWNQFASVRLRMDDFKGSIDQIKKSVSAIDENWIVDYHFMDENFERLHERDLVQGKIFGAFSIIAIIISCMGLLGLAIFSTSQRSKEVGIRKTFGASSLEITFLILKDFVLLFLVAYMISLPVSYFSINQWLNTFVYRIELSAITYLIAAAVMLTAVIITVGYNTLKTTLVNPADVLKNE